MVIFLYDDWRMSVQIIASKQWNCDNKRFLNEKKFDASSLQTIIYISSNKIIYNSVLSYN